METAQRPRVSAIVINWRAPEETRRAVESLLVQEAVVQVIVADNESSGGLDLPDDPRVTLVENTANLGFAGGVRSGLPHVTGEFVALLNNDAVAEPDWIAELLAAIHRHPRAGVAGGVELITGDGTRMARPPVLDPWLGEVTPEDRPLPELRVPYVSGGSMLFRRTLAENWDDGFFMYYEDADFCAQAWRSGHEVWFVPAALVEHQGSLSADRNPVRKWRDVYASRYRFVFKNFGGAHFWWAFLYGLAKNALGSAVWSVRASSDEERERARGRIQGTRAAVRALPALFRLRRARRPAGYCKLVESLNRERETALGQAVAPPAATARAGQP
jgi:GT2 family glycosyltransferase